jgi:hypothetical protein
MTKPSRQSAAVQLYLRRLENPYASLQMFDEPQVARDDAVNDESRLYRLRGNPYAKLVTTDGTQEKRVAPTKTSLAPSVAPIRQALSKSGFRAQAKRIFKQYVPALEKGRLRTHHQGFITRNESCLPTRRYRLIKHLERYDISKIQGLIPQFNRERDALTDEKLKQIERLADGKE